MCGICGVWEYGAAEGRVRVELVERMRDRMTHRGPDDAGTQILDGGRLGLGFRRLSIIDLSRAGNQPMRGCEGRGAWLVFNGEIYNHETLRRGLEGRGHAYRSRTDSETILHLYEERGLDFVEEIEGDFAVALWDAERERLVLARRGRAPRGDSSFAARVNQEAHDGGRALRRLPFGRRGLFGQRRADGRADVAPRRDLHRRLQRPRRAERTRSGARDGATLRREPPRSCHRRRGDARLPPRTGLPPGRASRRPRLRAALPRLETRARVGHGGRAGRRRCGRAVQRLRQICEVPSTLRTLLASRRACSGPPPA